jgi:hypothetical protein
LEIPDLKIVEKARAVIEELIAARHLGIPAVPYFAPTDLGFLPPALQEAEQKVQEENDYGNRVRAGVHMSLTAAVAALKVSEALMKGFTSLAPQERKRELMRCSQGAQAASDTAGQAAAVLAGLESPKSDSAMEIKRLGSALLQHFSQQSKG